MHGGEPCKNIDRRLPSLNQGVRPQENRLVTPESWTSSLQNCENINFCCFKKKKQRMMVLAATNLLSLYHELGVCAYTFVLVHLFLIRTLLTVAAIMMHILHT